MTEIIIRTERLLISTLVLEDAAFILDLLNEPAFIQFIGDRGVRDLQAARDYLLRGPLASYQQYGFGLWRVSLVSNGEPVGICGLIRREGLPEVDLGYAILENHSGQGYASEAAAAVRDYALQKLGLKSLLAITDPNNLGSIRVLEKTGLRLQGSVRLPGSEEDLNLFRMALVDEESG